MTGKRKRKLAMPDTLIIVASVVLLVAILSWIIPSGTYDYQEMNINGRIRNVAIDGTYHTIDKSEVTTTGFLGFFSVLYRGCVEAADVIFMILCCCGTFGVVVKTGAFHAGIGTMNFARYILPVLEQQKLGPVYGVVIRNMDRYCEVDAKEVIERLGKEYAKQIQKLGFKKVQLIGYCMGGLIASAVACNLLGTEDASDGQ